MIERGQTLAVSISDAMSNLSLVTEAVNRRQRRISIMSTVGAAGYHGAWRCAGWHFEAEACAG